MRKRIEDLQFRVSNAEDLVQKKHKPKIFVIISMLLYLLYIARVIVMK